MRICIIDDNEMVSEALTLVLRDRGHDVAVATSGIAGLAQIEADPPDAALVDLGLPDMPGQDVIALLRARIPHFPIVATSGHSSAATDADIFLEKPFTSSALLGALQRAVQARRSS